MRRRLRTTLLGALLLVIGIVTVSLCFGGNSAPVDDRVMKKTPSGTGNGDRPDAEKVTLSANTTKALEALGYFDRAATQNPEKKSVTKSKQTAFDGYNLFNSRNKAQARLLDMEGKVVHEWTAPTSRPPWMYTYLLPDGDLLAIAKGEYLARLTWDSKVRWKRVTGAHHDVTVGDDGRIYLLAHRVTTYQHKGADIPIMDDLIHVYTPDGELLRKHRLFPLLRDNLISKRRLDKIVAQRAKGVSRALLVREGAPADTTHTNSIQVLSTPIDGIAPKGAILLSVREIDRIVILNPEMDKVLWSWGAGELQGQHHAVHLPNGNITIFDNGTVRKKSRVIEVDPLSGKIVWSYEHPDFFSRLRGSAQTLPNGNVLITESDKGHAFEITREGNKVWAYWNEDVLHTTPPTRAVIYRLMRYPKNYLPDALTHAASNPPEN